MSSYDRALTVFSPEGELIQIRYASDAVNQGGCCVGVKGKDSLVLCVERKMGTQLQDTRTVKKIIKIDEHVFAAFAGLTADARVLGKRARSECANFQFNYDDKVSTEYISRYVAQIQQRYTQSGGRRPFGVSFIMAGVDESGKHAIYMTDPSGYFARYKAISCGQNSKTVQEFFDKNYKDDMSTDETLRLAVSSLMDVVDQSSRNIEVCQLKTTDNGCEARFVGEDELDELIKSIEKEKEEEEKKG